jgi:hypothetical protein
LFHFADRFHNRRNIAMRTKIFVIAGICLSLAAMALNGQEQAGFISGSVHESEGGALIANAEIYILGMDGTILNRTWTDAEGSYTSGALADGNYYVMASGTINGQGQIYGGVVYPNARFCSDGTLITVTSPNTTGGIDFTLSRIGSISGTVTESDGVTLIASMQIYVWDQAGNYVKDTWTDAQGQYTAGGLVSGAYYVSASGIVNGQGQVFVEEIYDGVRNISEGTAVPVTGPNTTIGINFSLVRMGGLSSTGFISGTATDSNGGAPIANAEIYILGMDGTIINTIWTDAEGSYTSGPLSDGNYYVMASGTINGQGQVYVSVAYPNAQYYSQGTQVTVTAPNTTGGIDFSLARMGFILGTATENEGATPIANLQVCAQNENGEFHDARSDAQGVYTISGLNAGTYKVWTGGFVDGQGVVYTNEYYNETTEMAATPVVVSAGQTASGINFTLYKLGGPGPGSNGFISGTVRESDGSAPVTNAQVDILDTNGVTVDHVLTNAAGVYTSNLLAPGKYYVFANGLVEGVGAVYAGVYYPNQRSYRPELLVEVTASNTSWGIDFSLARVGFISGTVRESDGSTPVANTWVYILDANGAGVDGILTNAEGFYTSYPLNPGNYYVNATGLVEGTGAVYVNVFFPNVQYYPQGTQVTVTAPNTTGGIDFSLARMGFISGTATENEGATPIANLQVCAQNENGEFHDARTDAQGGYTISGLNAGTYKVWTGGFVDGQGVVYTNEYYNETTEMAATPVVVTAGQTASGINFTLARMGFISGMAAENDGATPIANLQVCAQNENGEFHSFYTDAQGAYTISGLIAGTYTVWTGGYVDGQGLVYCIEYYKETTELAPTPVVVTAAQTTNGINFTLARMVEPPIEAIGDLISEVSSLGLKKGLENSLVVKLEQAIKALEKDKPQNAKNALGSFINEVNALSEGWISDEDAAELIENARSIIQSLASGLAKAEQGDEAIPRESVLLQNYPNPFNPVTEISYSLSEPCRVTLEIFDIMGSRVETFDNAEERAGSHSVTWNGKDSWGRPVPGGVYLCRMKAGSYQKMIRMLLLK